MKLKPDPNILHELRKIGEDVSSSYTGAFTVLDKKNNKERIAQSSSFHQRDTKSYCQKNAYCG